METHDLVLMGQMTLVSFMVPFSGAEGSIQLSPQVLRGQVIFKKKQNLISHVPIKTVSAFLTH